MIRMEINDFIFEMKEELVCYDEIGEKGAELWEKGFLAWLDNGVKKKRIAERGGKKYFLLDDESEVFDLADEYLEAYESNNIEKYWKEFR